MKANELRIGNLVLRNGFLPEHKETFNQIIVSHNDITACVVSPESFKPIPLSEEWLLRFGFEYSHRFGQRLFFNIGNLYIELFEDEKSSVYYHRINSICYLKYVHSLQNLYFALTGEELELKHEAN